MKKYKLQRLVPFLMISSMLLSSCGKKSECDIPTRHVHLYRKNFGKNSAITTYYDDERLDRHGYIWQPEYLEITKTDEELYRLFGSKDLFNGVDNWNYLYYEMSNNHDYLEFYYHYTTIETYTTTDSEGHTKTKTRTVTHSGWTDDPYYSHNTGLTRLNHHRYCGYRIVYKDGEFKLERSPYVDDVREVLEDYPYVRQNGYEIFYKDFDFYESELPYLDPDDFDVFEHPDLSNTTPYISKGLSR